MSNLIAKLLKPELVLMDLKSSTRLDAIRETADLLKDQPDMSHYEIFYDELLTREKVEPTCLGNEVAVPHARTDEVKRMMLAVGRKREGVMFDNCNQVVKLIFVIATPRKMVTEYLTLIGSLARLLKEESLRSQLLEADDTSVLMESLIDAERQL